MDGAEVEWWLGVIGGLGLANTVNRSLLNHVQCCLSGSCLRNRHLVDPRTSSGTLIVNYDSEDGE